MSARSPQYAIPQGQLGATEQSAYHVCTGIGPDLMEAAREAVRALIEHVVGAFLPEAIFTP